RNGARRPVPEPARLAPPETARETVDTQPLLQAGPGAPSALASSTPATVTVSSAQPVLSVPLPPAAAAPSAAPAPRVDEDARIRAALGKYREAYERLDAGAAKRVWSAVDERALSKAFANLESQSVSF